MTRHARILFTLSLVLVPAAVRAESPAFDVKAIDAFVADHVKEKKFVGLSLAVLRHGEPALVKAYGKRSLEDGSPVDLDTKFAIGSVTKQFVCACALLLAEDGKLAVQDKVAKWYPNLTRAGDISLYDLMSHCSGYPDYYPLDFIDRRLEKPIALDRLIQEYATGKLDFEPGTRWSYSNTGYIILGRIVEKVSGKSLGEFLGNRVFQPLGMANSTFEPKQTATGLARGYTSFMLGPLEPAVPEAAGWCHAAGGIWSTAGDLIKWDLGLMTGKVLKPDSFRLMTTPRLLATGKSKGYGCGLSIATQNGERVLAHGGAVSGFHTRNILLPGAKSAIAISANSEVVEVEPIVKFVAERLIAKDDGPDVAVPKIQGLSAKEAARELFRQMAKGEIDRAKLGEEYSHYLTAERVRAAKERLQPLGEPDAVVVEHTAERGGM
ncbi:MAG: serine hydrolase domain-containing protein, partial [Gemmataceae bacterium]